MVLRDVDPPRPCERLERERQVATTLLVNQCDLVQHCDLVERVADVVELGIEDHDELLPPVFLAIDGLEEIRDPLAMVLVHDEPLERRHRALPLQPLVDHLLVLIDRRGQILELDLEHLGELQP